MLAAPKRPFWGERTRAHQQVHWFPCTKPESFQSKTQKHQTKKNIYQRQQSRTRNLPWLLCLFFFLGVWLVPKGFPRCKLWQTSRSNPMAERGKGRLRITNLSLNAPGTGRSRSCQWIFHMIAQRVFIQTLRFFWTRTEALTIFPQWLNESSEAVLHQWRRGWLILCGTRCFWVRMNNTSQGG